VPTPLLNPAVYYLIFGVLFKANRGISNCTAYLVTGVFIFVFTEPSIVVGSTVIRSNITLIRAPHFPRACLPLAYMLVEFQQLPLSIVVLFAIVLGTGERRADGVGQNVLAFNPAAVDISLTRYAVMSSYRAAGVPDRGRRLRLPVPASRPAVRLPGRGPGVRPDQGPALGGTGPRAAG
jgi:hypothetical protein